MTKFIKACKLVAKRYPVLWNHTTKRNRRIMVQYWLPCQQLAIFNEV